MVVLALLVVVIAVVVWLSTHRGQAPAPQATVGGGRAPALGGNGAGGALRRWVEAGLITPDQVQAIEAYEQDRAKVAGALGPPGTGDERQRRSGLPPIAEALGYLGATLAIVGVVLVLQQTWDQLGTLGHLVLTGGASAALYVVGRAVGGSDDPALGRMRAFAWLCSSAAGGAFAVVGAHDVLGVDGAEGLWLAGSLGVGLHSGALWRGLDRPAQQFPALVAAVAATISAGVVVTQALDVAETTMGWLVSPPTAAVGGALLVVGIRRMLPHSGVTVAVGTFAVLAAAMLVSTSGSGPGFLVALGLGLALLAVVASPLPTDRSDRAVLGIGGVLVVMFWGPPAIGWYGRDAGLATGLVVLVAGAALVALGLAGRSRAPHALQAAGSATVLVGAGVTAMQVPDVAPALGLALSVVLLALGTRPGAVVLSITGAVGLLVNVPWAIARWFPGEDVAAVLVLASGITILAVAVALARMGGRMRAELGRGGPAPAPPP